MKSSHSKLLLLNKYTLNLLEEIKSLKLRSSVICKYILLQEIKKILSNILHHSAELNKTSVSIVCLTVPCQIKGTQKRQAYKKNSNLAFLKLTKQFSLELKGTEHLVNHRTCVRKYQLLLPG